MLALERATRDGRIDGRIVSVISDRADAAGLDAARKLGLETAILETAPGIGRAEYGRRLSAVLERSGAGLVALAGFMRILDGGFVRQWQGRLLNIHPSLLPAHRGLHTHRRVLEAGERQHGCTVHFVVEELDAGPAVIQGRLAVRRGEDEDRAFSARSAPRTHYLSAGRRLVCRRPARRGAMVAPCWTGEPQARRSSRRTREGDGHRIVRAPGSDAPLCGRSGRRRARAFRRGIRRPLRAHGGGLEPDRTLPHGCGLGDGIDFDRRGLRPGDRKRHAETALGVRAPAGWPAPGRIPLRRRHEAHEP